MSVSSLERVHRYAYSNGYSWYQWSIAVKQCLQRSEKNSGQDLCDILLKHFFSGSRVYNTLLGSYMAYTLTGKCPSTMTTTTKDFTTIRSKSLVNGKQFLSRLTTKDLHFSFNREFNTHWAFMLHLLPSILSEMDGDDNENRSWVPILSKLLVILSHIVAVGLYPQQKSIQKRHQYYSDDDVDDSDSDDIMKQPTPEEDWTASQQTVDDDPTASQQFNYLTSNTNQWANDSQMTIDPDSTFDADETQLGPFTEQHHDSTMDVSTETLLQGTSDTTRNILYNAQHGILQQNPTYTTQYQHPSQSSSLYPNSWFELTSVSMTMESHSLELDNAISAAKLLIDLIERKGIKGMIDKFIQEQNGEKEVLTWNPEDSWMKCYEILVPDDRKSTKNGPSSAGTHNSNTYIQKLLLLIERLADRNVERRLAVHMKYHELEDEGTARAMPSAGLMGLIYHMVQIRPTLDDDELVNRLVKLQAIKGSFDESFYLEMWFAALTGLREASLSTSCTNKTPKNNTGTRNLDHSCNTTASTNRLLWKNLVLVKVPYLIHRLEEQKEQDKVASYNLKNGHHQKAIQQTDINAIESSLTELKKFTGLLNACSPSACCSNFYVPSSKSTSFVDQLIFDGTNDADDNSDDMMDMINNVDNESTQGIHSPLFIKSIRHISTDDIFTSIIRSCQFYNLLPESRAELLLDMKVSKTENDIEDEASNYFDNTKPTMEKQSSCSSLFRDFDDTMITVDTPDQQSNHDGELDIVAQIYQIIEQRMDSIHIETSQEYISELIHIGLISFVHWRKIVDFLLKLLSDKVMSRDICGLSRLCGALCDCPPAIDLILQLHPPRDLLGPLEQVCNEWKATDDYMDVDDGGGGKSDDSGDRDMDEIQSWCFKFGKIWSYVLIVANKIDTAHIVGRIFKNRNGLCYQFFATGTIIYGVDVYDEEVDKVIDRWVSAIVGNRSLDNLLRTTDIQLALQIIPSIIDRLLSLHHSGKIDLETLTGALAYFQKQSLQFLIVPGVTQTLCNKLLTGDSSTALVCMSRLFLDKSLPYNLLRLCASTVIGSLQTWKEYQRQYRKLGGDNNTQHHTQQQQQTNTVGDEQQANSIENIFISKLDLGDQRHVTNLESCSLGATRRTLSEKTKEMFQSIVKSGRSMHMNDMGMDAEKLWEPLSTKSSKQVVAHYLDLVMFQAALKMAGIHCFTGMIVDEVLEAGKSGGAVRAVELGSGLLTTPLTYHCYGEDTCLSILWCLLQDVIPFAISDCASKDASFFQGQTLGVFVSDCLVLMYRKANDQVDRLGCQFFEALVIDRVRGGDLSLSLSVPQASSDGSKFAPWDEEVVYSAVWRGFVKGLMSNPLIKEMWPKAYT